jgi:hypothetical protein
VADVFDIALLGYAGSEIARQRFAAAQAAAVRMETWTDFRSWHAGLPRSEARRLYFDTRKVPVSEARARAASASTRADDMLTRLGSGQPLTRAGQAFDVRFPNASRWVGVGGRVIGVAGVAYDGIEFVQAARTGDTEGMVTNGLSMVGTGMMMTGNPVLMGVGAVMVGGVLIYENWDAISEFAGNAADWTGDRLDDAGGWAGDRLDDAGGWAGDRLDDAGGWAGDRLGDAGDLAGSFVSSVWP